MQPYAHLLRLDGCRETAGLGQLTCLHLNAFIELECLRLASGSRNSQLSASGCAISTAAIPASQPAPTLSSLSTAAEAPSSVAVATSTVAAAVQPTSRGTPTCSPLATVRTAYPPVAAAAGSGRRLLATTADSAASTTNSTTLAFIATLFTPSTPFATAVDPALLAPGSSTERHKRARPDC